MVQLYSLNKAIQAEYDAVRSGQSTTNNDVSISDIASQTLGVIFSAMAPASYSSESISSGSSTATEATNDADNTEVLGQRSEPEKTVDDVKALLKGKVPEKSKHWDELTSKYNLHKSMGMDDGQIVDRLCCYYKALVSHDCQVRYGELYEIVLPYVLAQHSDFYNLDPEEQERIFDQCAEECDAITQGKSSYIPELINKNYKVDNDNVIEANLPKNQGGEVTAGYVDAIYKRGVGYVDLYDKNGDSNVSLEEFIAFEQEDAGRTLTADEKAEAKRLFNLMNANKENGGIDKQRVDAHEMAAYMFAVSRLHDDRSKGENTANDITFQEWYDAQSGKYDSDIIGWRDAFLNSTPGLGKK